MAEPKTASQAVRDLYQNHIGFWQPRREAMRQCKDFLAGDRYQNDHGAYQRDRRLLQIKGQETQDTIRHIAAEATAKPRSIEPRPIDRDDDPEAGELAVSLIENELGNPWKGFEECYEAAILDCRESRLGIVWMDWEPECGPFGEILYSRQPADRTMWDPAYESPHHPMCGWLIREKRPEVEDARRIYKAPWLMPDRDAFTPSGDFKEGVPLVTGASGERLPGQMYTDNRVTLWECWYKNDKTEAEKPTTRELELEPEQRYMICLGQCGYRTPNQETLQRQDKIENELPEYLEQGCPTCGGDLERIDAKDSDDYSLAYAKGKRLVIVAPFSVAPDDKAVYDGSWPVPTARSFPGLFLTAYQKPGEPVGPCDVDFMWNQQQASDQLRTLAIQRVFEHRNYWILPKAGITDYRGKRFNFREDQFNVMYRDGSQMFPNDVEMKSGSGLDPAFPIAFDITQAALTQYRGVTDLGFTPESTKNIAASTVSQLNQMGNVPIAHFNRRKSRELSKFCGVVWDYIRSTYTPERLSRLNIEGTFMLMSLSGDDLPGYDIVIEDTPDFTGLEKARSEAFEAYLGIVTNPVSAPYADIFAELNNLPRSVVKKIEKRRQEVMAALATVPTESGTDSEESGAAPPQDDMSMNGGMAIGALDA